MVSAKHIEMADDNRVEAALLEALYRQPDLKGAWGLLDSAATDILDILAEEEGQSIFDAKNKNTRMLRVTIAVDRLRRQGEVESIRRHETCPIRLTAKQWLVMTRSKQSC